MTSLVIPICAAIVILWGIYKRTDIFGEFVKGAADNLKTCAELLPTLIALITAVGMFKASGAMELITNVSCMRASSRTAAPTALRARWQA